MLVKAITPSNASIFPEYIIPNIRYLYKDPDVSVRCVLAQCIAPLADTSLRYLEMGQALKAHGTFKLTQTDDYDEALYEVHTYLTLVLPWLYHPLRYHMTLACRICNHPFKTFLFPS